MYQDRIIKMRGQGDMVLHKTLFAQLQPMYMSEYLLSVEPHVSSFSTGAKFNKEMLQKDKIIMPKSMARSQNLSQNNIDSKVQLPVTGEKRVQHPFLLQSRQFSIP